jgi:hypothetical protein
LPKKKKITLIACLTMKLSRREVAVSSTSGARFFRHPTVKVRRFYHKVERTTTTKKM